MGFTQVQPVPMVPPRSLKRFVDKALSTIEFARVIELSLKEAADEKSIKLDLNAIQMVCWRYVCMCVGVCVYLCLCVSVCGCLWVSVGVCLWVCVIIQYGSA